jgi:hypothetical protein
LFNKRRFTFWWGLGAAAGVILKNHWLHNELDIFATCDANFTQCGCLKLRLLGHRLNKNSLAGHSFIVAKSDCWSYSGNFCPQSTKPACMQNEKIINSTKKDRKFVQYISSSSSSRCINRFRTACASSKIVILLLRNVYRRL